MRHKIVKSISIFLIVYFAAFGDGVQVQIQKGVQVAIENPKRWEQLLRPRAAGERRGAAARAAEKSEPSPEPTLAPTHTYHVRWLLYREEQPALAIANLNGITRKRYKQLEKYLVLARDANSYVMAYAARIEGQSPQESIVVGFLIDDLRKPKDNKIEFLFTHPDYHRYGVHEALVNYVVQHNIGTENRDRIVYMAPSEDMEWLTYLGRRGFRATGKVVKGYFPRGEEAYEMIRSIWEEDKDKGVEDGRASVSAPAQHHPTPTPKEALSAI